MSSIRVFLYVSPFLLSIFKLNKINLTPFLGSIRFKVKGHGYKREPQKPQVHYRHLQLRLNSIP